MRRFDWRRTSTRAHAGLQQPEIVLDQSPLRAAFDDDPNWQQRFRTYIEDANDEGPPQKQRDRLVGGRTLVT